MEQKVKINTDFDKRLKKGTSPSVQKYVVSKYNIHNIKLSISQQLINLLFIEYYTSYHNIVFQLINFMMRYRTNTQLITPRVV